MPTGNNGSQPQIHARDSLAATNVYFRNLIDLVPAQAYFDTESNEILSNHAKETLLSQSDSTSKAHLPDVKNEKRLNKKARLNPAQPTKTTELQKILPQLQAASEANIHDSKSASLLNSNCNINGDSSAARVVRTGSEDSKASKKRKLSSRNQSSGDSNLEVKAAVATTPSKINKTGDGGKDTLDSEFSTSSSDGSKAPSPAATSVKLDREQLLQKLQAKRTELQAKRRKGLTVEEFFESKKLRRKESKLKLKQKRKEAKKLKLSIEKQAKNSQHKLNGVSEVKPDNDSAKAPANGMVFSKFQFSEQAKRPKDRKQKKPKSYKELYEKVTKDKSKLEELKDIDPEKAKKLAEKAAWRKAMDQSKGVKVKDNPELIKKSMKKEEKLKQRSQKKWEERTSAVAEQQHKRQDKRKKNILAKKQTKQDRKVKLAKKKGRMISGF